MKRGEQEVELFRQMILKTLSKPANASKGHWLNMKRWQIWAKLIEESFEVLTAYLWLCWAETCHERKNTHSTLVSLCITRNRLGEEIADLSAVLMFLADSTAALYQPNRKPVNQ